MEASPGESEILRQDSLSDQELEDSFIIDNGPESSNELVDFSEDRQKYNIMNFALTNARSLPPKINSFVTAMDELALDFFMILETWISNSKTAAQSIRDLGNAENFQLICKNRTTRGGGVCVAFHKCRANLSRFPLPSSPWEIVCASGKIAGFSRKIAVIALYIPPKFTAVQLSDFCDYIADAVEKVKRDLQNPYVCIGGDVNNRDISPAFKDFPDISMLPNVATRRGAALDICFTNYCDDVFRVDSRSPLTSLDGVESDHLL